ncbi:4'-phosphopantetheinyl transferase family protein [Erwinia tasmaniensis]|uniref:Enterobactin synthase component D n=1 Tax=Erwinia tasmaniensis (strain DSM 17950 / CFBP 7177 / CIP 109463 / NCPPB 4357 / Et1/99) TaxID=465817 RepID=B2VDC6_ERWT9|nr:4'-phosphopantetheinyl transferase superfamily protein [Erwinia tasmaniensis]CAO97964.1 probable 4'-phosphopantetheinyl transferase [Erwinia tasmaniensis Et1/99]
MNGFSSLELPAHFLSGTGSISYFKLDKGLVNMRRLVAYCPELPIEIQLSIESRRIEYLAGRYCAVQALLHLGVAAPWVGRHADRSPSWPVETCGSLSHTDDRVIACTGWRADFRGMGIDIEKTVQPEILASLQHLVFTEQDKRLVETSNLPPCQIATLLFSAKEAFYKFIYPLTLTQMDFTDIFLLSVHENSFILQTNRDIEGFGKKGKKVRGIYHYEGEYVITLVAM